MSDRIELLKQTVEDFELLVDEGKVEWVDVKLGSLPTSTRTYLETMLDEAGIPYKISKLQPNGTFFFKLDNPLVGFLHHDPVLNTHVWICKNFKYGLNNQAVFNYLVALKVERGVVDFNAVHMHNEVLKSRHRDESDE